MNTERFNIFSSAYRDGLLAAVLDKQNVYYYGPDAVPGIADRMLAAIADHPRRVNYNSGGFKRACKTLNIRFSATAILEFLEVKDDKKEKK